MDRTFERPRRVRYTARRSSLPQILRERFFVSDSSAGRGWSDRKADAVAVLVIFAAAVSFAIYFISSSA
jgi:hypothetical protein